MKRLYLPCLGLAAVMLPLSLVLIARAPYESTMGLVQKIFYFHVSAAMVMFASTVVCGIASAIFLFRGHQRADAIAAAAAELTVVFGLIVLVTGPLWARKSWGVWWQWDARLTTTLLLWMIFVAYLLVRRFGGLGSEKLAAGLGLFGMADVPIVYVSVNLWRTVHPKTTVVPSLGPGMREAFWMSMLALALVFVVLLTARIRLAEQQAELDELLVEAEEGT